MTEREEWRPIEGFEGYEVSNLGRVRSWRKSSRWGVFKRDTPFLLKAHKDGSGYYRIKIYRNKAPKSFSVHRLVAQAFCEKATSATEVNHIDCNKTNNNASNLEWLTREENIKHCIENNLMKAPRGSKSSFAKLKESDVIKIFADTRPRRILAKEYGVTVDCIRKIKLKQNWSHLWK